MSDTPDTPLPKKKKPTRIFNALRTFGHPDGSGTIKAGQPVSLTSAQAKKLNKCHAIGVHIVDEDEDEDDD